MINFDHLLAGCLASDNPELKNIWEDYKREIEQYTGNFPGFFSELLHSDWYQATGDPRDGRLVGMLHVVRKREEVFSYLRENGSIDNIESDFHQILGKYTQKAHQAFLRVFNINCDFVFHNLYK